QPPALFPLTPPASTSLYTLSLHDALPIFGASSLENTQKNPARDPLSRAGRLCTGTRWSGLWIFDRPLLPAARGSLCSNLCAAFRSEEHTSELQSRFDLVCRLLLEKKKTNI